MKEIEKFKEEDEAELTDAEGKAATAYGVYGNSLTFIGNKVHYKRNDKGTPNYGCGTDGWIWTKKQGDTFDPGNKCRNGKYEYKMTRP